MVQHGIGMVRCMLWLQAMKCKCSKVRSSVVIAGKCTPPPSPAGWWVVVGEIRPIGVVEGALAAANLSAPPSSKLWWAQSDAGAGKDRSNRWWQGRDNFPDHLHISNSQSTWVIPGCKHLFVTIILQSSASWYKTPAKPQGQASKDSKLWMSLAMWHFYPSIHPSRKEPVATVS